MSRRLGPSDETLAAFGITPKERALNVAEQERQLDLAIESALAKSEEAETDAVAAPDPEPATAPEPEDIEARAEREADEWEARGVIRAALRRFSPREEPGKA